MFKPTSEGCDRISYSSLHSSFHGHAILHNVFSLPHTQFTFTYTKPLLSLSFLLLSSNFSLFFLFFNSLFLSLFFSQTFLFLSLSVLDLRFNCLFPFSQIPSSSRHVFFQIHSFQSSFLLFSFSSAFLEGVGNEKKLSIPNIKG